MAVTKKGLQTHQHFLRGFIRNDKLQPSRRLLAEMVLLYMEGHLPYSFVESIYGNAGKIRWNEGGEGADPPEDAANLEAQKVLKELYRGVQEENGTTTTNSNETGS